MRNGIGETFEFIVFLFQLLLEVFALGDIDDDNQVLRFVDSFMVTDSGNLDRGPDDVTRGFQVALDQVISIGLALSQPGQHGGAFGDIVGVGQAFPAVAENITSAATDDFAISRVGFDDFVGLEVREHDAHRCRQEYLAKARFRLGDNRIAATIAIVFFSMLLH